MRDRRGRQAYRETCCVGMAGGMNAAAENFLGAFYLEIIGNAIAVVMVAQEHFIGWMLKVKVLHGTSLACGVEQCHCFERPSFARRSDPFFVSIQRSASRSASVRRKALLMCGIAAWRCPVVHRTLITVACENRHLIPQMLDCPRPHREPLNTPGTPKNQRAGW